MVPNLASPYVTEIHRDLFSSYTGQMLLPLLMGTITHKCFDSFIVGVDYTGLIPFAFYVNETCKSLTVP